MKVGFVVKNFTIRLKKYLFPSFLIKNSQFALSVLLKHLFFPYRFKALPIANFFIGGKIKAAENGVCFYLFKFASQTFLSSVVSHFVAKQLKKSILKLKFYS